jgi:mRNA-degrading endonuclease toxin of MazEF toxin-antitoxin module
MVLAWPGSRKPVLGAAASGRREMQRGEIWWADFPAPVHRHPVVIVSREKSLEASDTVVVARITARIRETPEEVPIGAEDGLPKTVINTRLLSTISKKSLVSRIASLSPRKILQLDEALRYALDLPAADVDRPQLPVKQPRLHFGGSSFSREPS